MILQLLCWHFLAHNILLPSLSIPCNSERAAYSFSPMKTHRKHKRQGKYLHSRVLFNRTRNHHPKEWNVCRRFASLFYGTYSFPNPKILRTSRPSRRFVTLSKFVNHLCMFHGVLPHLSFIHLQTTTTTPPSHTTFYLTVVVSLKDVRASFWLFTCLRRARAEVCRSGKENLPDSQWIPPLQLPEKPPALQNENRENSSWWLPMVWSKHQQRKSLI